MASEKFLKRLMGKTEVEDALERLDMLTKEETLMAVTKNLEVTYHVDGNVTAVKGIVHDIDGNVKETKGIAESIDGNVKGTKDLVENIDDNVKVTKALAEDVGDNVKVTKHGTQHFCPPSYIFWPFSICPQNSDRATKTFVPPR
jgi:porphobilinogen deaminase